MSRTKKRLPDSLTIKDSVYILGDKHIKQGYQGKAFNTVTSKIVHVIRTHDSFYAYCHASNRPKSLPRKILRPMEKFA